MLEVAIAKHYPDFTLETSFSLGRETMLLSGSSGSGKTTLLRCLAGLERPDHGFIIYDNQYFYRENKNELAPHLRRTALMSQDDTLFPHLRVKENILYAVKKTGLIPGDTYYKLSCQLNLQPLEKSYPASLSGGEKRRVQLARTLLRRPSILLLDEPFSGLDRSLCKVVSKVIADYHHSYHPVLIIASHINMDLIGWAERQLNLEKCITPAITTETMPVDEEKDHVYQLA